MATARLAPSTGLHEHVRLEDTESRQQVAERFERFLRIVVPILASSKDRASYVDMRYSRGFAIGWSSAMTPGRSEQKEKQSDV